MASEQASERIETVIVGGGQAGLAAGYHLTRRGRECVILDAHERVGDSWRKRWPSLRLYSPAKADGLPGLPFPARRSSFPSGYEMADYLEAYAAHFELPARTGIKVDGLFKDGDGYVVTAGRRRFEAENVIVATGVMQEPVVPDFAAELDPGVTQLHSADYRTPAQLRDGPVLVVGAAHSGADIAHEVARAGYPTILSGRHPGQMPFAIEGRVARVMFPVLRFVATRVLTVNTPLGRKARPKIRAHGGPLLRIKAADLAAAGVERIFARAAGVVDGMPVLDDGTVLEVRNVIWCTGFRNDHSWIRFPLPLDEDGYPEQRHGAVPSSPGLYFVGMLFLDSFASMLIIGTGRDAERVAKHIAGKRARSPRAALAPAAAALR